MVLKNQNISNGRKRCSHDSNEIDFAILMFNVVGYIEDLEQFFNLKKILNKDAVIIFDFWDGKAIEKEKPIPTKKILAKKEYIN